MQRVQRGIAGCEGVPSEAHEQMRAPLREVDDPRRKTLGMQAQPEHVDRRLEQVLNGHEPCPALVVDRHWDLVSANRALASLVEGAAAHLLEPPVNVLRLSLHPEGVAPRIINLPQWRTHLLRRLRRDALATGDPALNALYEELTSYPSGDPGQPLDPAFAEVAVPLRVRDRKCELSFMSTRTTFGDALDVTVAELSIESFFPTDERTADAMRATTLGTRRDAASPPGEVCT